MEYSFQLFSARRFPPLDDTLSLIKRLGYTQTEGWGGLYGDLDDLGAGLSRHGLTMPTGHFDLEQLQDREFSLRVAEAVGLEMFICPWIDADRRADDAQWRWLAEELARLDDQYRADGYRFGWHSHEFEFVPLSDGTLPMDLILDTAPTLEWQFDIAWAVFGQVDPVPWLEARGGRITALHIRDLAKPGEHLDEDGGTDIGYGTLDWTRYIEITKRATKTEFFVFEHDEPNDVARFATRSIATARRWP